MSPRPKLFLIIAFLAGACSKPPKPAPGPPVSYDVILVPTEDFPTPELNWLAGTVAADTGLNIKAMLPLGSRDWKPYGDREYQYDPDVLRSLALPAIERLKATYGGKVYVILTLRDIGPSDQSLNFLFVKHDHVRKISVASAARALVDEEGKLAPQEVIRSRVRKIVLRTIALQYYGLERSTKIEEVTYSPLMGVPDLDAMGLVIPTK